MLAVLGIFTAETTPTSAFVANLPPTWDLPSEFSTQSELRIDLTKAFFDPDFDTLSFSVSASPGGVAFIEGDELVVQVDKIVQVSVTATDGQAVVKKTITIVRQ